MSSSNLWDHCALALTVLLSGNGMELGRLQRSVATERMRSPQQSSLGRMGRLWEVPGCHHHHIPTLVMSIRSGWKGTWEQPSVFAEQGEHLPLCWHLLLPVWLH